MYGSKRYLRSVLVGLVCIWVLVSPVSAELEVLDKAKVRDLVEATKAARESVTDLRATVRSTHVFLKPGEPTFETETVTRWLGKGGRFKYVTESEEAIDGKPVRPSMEAEAGPSPRGRARCERAFSGGGILMNYWPDRRKAVIQDMQGSEAASPIARAQQEPLFYGMAVRGLSLENVAAGESWMHRPEDDGIAAKRVISYGGPRIYEGREVIALTVDVAWTDANTAARSRRYEIYVDPGRGFTIPFISLEAESDGVRDVVETVQTSCADWGNGIWGPETTVHTIFFDTKKGKGTTTVTTHVNDVVLNSGVSDDELKIALPDGTRIDDQIAGVYYEFSVGEQGAIIDSIIQSLEDAGCVHPELVPIAAETDISGGKHHVVPELTPVQVVRKNRGRRDWLTGCILAAAAVGAAAVLVLVTIGVLRRSKEQA